MLNFEESLKKFNLMPLEFKITVDSAWVSGRLAILEKRYGLNLSPLLIYVATADIPFSKIGKYLENEHGLEALAAASLQEELASEVFEPLYKRLNLINANPEKAVTFKQESFYLLEIFSKDLIREFRENPVITEAINARIFNILANDLSFQDELEKALFKNQELLTGKDFFLENRKVQPTIMNWLSDFMKRYGTDIFDQLVMTDFIIKHKNCLPLDEDEKNLVKKLLLLYRNLKFFPLSMPSDNTDEWEILPVDKPDPGIPGKASLDIPKTREEKEIEIIKAEKGNYEEESLEQAALEEAIRAKRHLEDLKIEAGKYAEGSLERMALAEEISRLEK